jgi:hypothetical protein
MAYNITQTNGNILTSVPDGQTVSSYGGLTLIGKKYPGFGTLYNNNLIHIVENFANANPPVNPFVGQLWYDTSSNTISFWDGVEFNTIGVITSSDSAPVHPTEGDEWFNSVSNQLYVWNGNNWVLIGPPGASGGGSEGLIVNSITVDGNKIYYLELYADNKLLGIISGQKLTHPGIAGFGDIRAGLNFVVSPTLGEVSAGIFNIDELTIGDSDQIDFKLDNQDNFILALNENTNGGNVLIADTNGTTPPELSTLVGTVYVNNIVALGGISGGTPGEDGQILFNDHGVTGASGNVYISSDRTTLNVSNVTSSSIYGETINGGTVNTTNENVSGLLTVVNETVNNSLNVIGTATFNSGTGNEFTLPTTAGTSGKVLSSNGDGTTSWDSSVAGWSSGSTGFTYWQKDPTGLIRQWGIGPSMPPNSDNICYMPYSFSNTNYTITIGNVREPGGNSVFVMVRDATKNLNYFTMTTGAGEFIGTSAPYWYAIGY